MTWAEESHQHRLKVTRLRLKAAQRPGYPQTSGNCKVTPLLAAGAMAAMMVLRPSFRQVPSGTVYRGPALATLRRLWWQLLDMLPGSSRPRGHKLGSSSASHPSQQAARISSGSAASASSQKPPAESQSARKAQRKQKKGRKR
ncbi:hypothetical protein WJX84_004525 [Apatococcus fuscideae]|uniref:Uncharacterized protein n=1 Tax=Apatococcus fuscideae TaxID=2026836 RepID=A0AAW1SU31_9CHLO